MIRPILLIAGRELRAYVERPSSWVLATLGLLPMGIYFGARIWFYSQAVSSPDVAAYVDLDPSAALLTPFYEFSAFVFLLLLPLWSMRLLTEERNTNVLSLLLSSPITPGQLVVGKFLGIFAFFAVFLALVSLMPLMLMLFGDPDPRTLMTGLGGLLLLGAVMLAVGTAASAMTNNGLVAAALTITVLLVLLMAGFLDDPSRSDPVTGGLRVLAVWNHAGRLWEGLVLLSDIVASFAITTFFLVLARQRVDAMTWR